MRPDVLRNVVSVCLLSLLAAAQVARVLRQAQGRQDEEVALITSAPPRRLDALSWLKLNRAGWGIESGLHQRLDISHKDDRSRIQSDRGMLVMGLFRRLANSLYLEWQPYQRHPHHVTTTNSQTLMTGEHGAKAHRFVLTKHPSLNFPSCWRCLSWLRRWLTCRANPALRIRCQNKVDSSA